MAAIIKMIAGGLIVTAGIGLGVLAVLSGKHSEKYSIRWIESLSDTEWETERERVRLMFCSPKFDDATRLHFREILNLFDKVKSKKDWADKEPGFPVHNEHDWHLSSN